jgi:hypothetical protein
VILRRRRPDLLERLGLSGESKPEPPAAWLDQLQDGLAGCEGVVSAYLAYERRDDGPGEALFVEIEEAPPDAEWVEAFSVSLERSGAKQTALERALARHGGTSAGFSIHFFTERDLGLVREAGLPVWQREQAR